MCQWLHVGCEELLAGIESLDSEGEGEGEREGGEELIQNSYKRPHTSNNHTFFVPSQNLASCHANKLNNFLMHLDLSSDP